MASTPIKHSERNAEIKQNLFRFVHIKDITIGTDVRELVDRTITSNPEQSDFLTPIKDIQDPKARQTEIDKILDDFVPFSSFKDVNALNPSITDFSHWLKANKSKLTLVKTRSNLDGILNYNSEQKRKLWDNLFYQTLTNKSTLIRDVILSLLKADFFILKFNDFNSSYTSETFTKNQKRKIEKVSKANVLIPSYLFPKESNPLASVSRDSKGDKNLSKV